MVEDLHALDQVLEQLDLNFVGQGKHKITAKKLFSTFQALLLDVRTPEEQASMPLLFPRQVNSVHIPLNELPARWTEIDSRSTVGIFCPQGVRASIAYTYLRARGYTNIRVIEGGYAGLAEMTRPAMLLAHMAQ